MITPLSSLLGVFLGPDNTIGTPAVSSIEFPLEDMEAALPRAVALHVTPDITPNPIHESYSREEDCQ